VSGDATVSVTAALLGLDGFVVLAAADAGGEVELLVETTAELVGCPECGRWPGPKTGARRGCGICRLAVARWWFAGTNESGAAHRRRARSRRGRKLIRRSHRGHV
jgi:hypothetical protein